MGRAGWPRRSVGAGPDRWPWPTRSHARRRPRGADVDGASEASEAAADPRSSDRPSASCSYRDGDTCNEKKEMKKAEPFGRNEEREKETKVERYSNPKLKAYYNSNSRFTTKNKKLFE